MKVVEVDLHPHELARLFWDMGSDEQCEFFAHLHRLAGDRLCVQMAWVASDAADLYAKGEPDARYGLEKVAGHGETMRELAIDRNVNAAKRELAQMVRGEPTAQCRSVAP
jgi:hypothetical protein